jgi:hypothetical protein
MNASLRTPLATQLVFAGAAILASFGTFAATATPAHAATGYYTAQLAAPVEGTAKTVINDVFLRVKEGEFVTVVGPSGCGKSTLLRMVLGSQQPTSGSVLVDGNSVSRITRDCGIVYQNYSLFPHLSVRDNIALGIMLENVSMPERMLVSPLMAGKKVLDFTARLMHARAGRYAAGGRVAALATGDWNRDGLRDLAAADDSRVLFFFGAGTERRVPARAGETPPHK